MRHHVSTAGFRMGPLAACTPLCADASACAPVKVLHNQPAADDHGACLPACEVPV